jgi:hypothetical protein
VQMDVLVTQQEETINAIETAAVHVEQDTEAGYVECLLASISWLTGIAASHRRKKPLTMRDQRAENVGYVSSFSSLSWPPWVLRSVSLWGSSTIKLDTYKFACDATWMLGQDIGFSLTIYDLGSYLTQS